MLSKIIEQKKIEVENLEEVVLEQPVIRKSLHSALSKPNRKLGLIAEVKKASPSKGVIRENFDPLQIAKEYEETKADAISVLTDVTFFQGSIEYLMEIKENVNLPILRKDFIIDSRQISQSEKMGADAILLIGEVLEPLKLYEFYCEAYERGLECLVEVHSRKTLEQVCKYVTPKLVGINNRNLKNFITSINHTKEIIKDAPKESLVISESGILSRKDLDEIISYGAHATLIGEAFMRYESPGRGIRKLFGEVNYETASH